VCRTGSKAKVSSFNPHHGEENPIRGWRGSGTIFFTRCNLKCQYCQNHGISQIDSGEEVSPDDMAKMMLRLQSYGCHNINFVSPSHVVPQIIAAVMIAVKAGLYIPLVYNSGGYDSLTMLALLDGIIDIYMPDMKYGDLMLAQKYSKIPNYTMINQAAVKEMHRQVGDLIIDKNGLAVRGLLVRHLVLPESLAGTKEIVNFLAEEISKDTYLNLMDQYRPSYHADQYPELNRPILKKEYQGAVEMATIAGLHRFE
jgi:putative pyruvate formate lyase activating enzyme